MKGIRKLFFGLFLMTLIGVGFKIDAKADPILKITGLSEPASWGGSNTYMEITFDANEDTYTADTTVEFSIGEIASATARFYYDAGASKIDITGGDAYIVGNLISTKGLKIAVAVDKDDVYDLLDTNGTAALTASENFSNTSKSATVTASKVSVSATYNNGSFPTGADTVVFDPSSPFYLLNGDKQTVSIATSPGTGYKIDSWTIDGAVSSYKNSVSVTGNKSAIKVVANYTKNNGALDIDGLDGYKILVGNTSAGLAYTMEGYEESNVSDVTLDGADINYNFDGTSGSGNFKFEASGTAGTKTLKVIMKDGVEYEYSVTLCNKPSAISFASSSLYTYVTYSNTLTPKYTGTAPSSVDYVPVTGYENYFTGSPSGINYTFTGVSPTPSSGILVTATPKYDIDGYETGSPVKVYLKVFEEPEATLADSVYVNKGLTINLAPEFVTADDYTITGTATNYTSGLITIDPNGVALNKIKIKGVKAGTQKEGIELFGDKATVTVYPEPTIKLDSTTGSSSSSGSSYNPSYKFTVTMPAGDYHDDYADSLSTIELVAISSSGDKKSLKTVSASSSSSSTSTTKTYSATVTAQELANAIGSNSESVTIRAYAYPGERDDSIYADYKLTYNYNSGSSSSSSSSSSNRNSATEGMDDYDDVPKTGESKADIWILWSVLFVSILGAGFMIWKRFGLVRAIAEADEEVAVAEHKEEVKAKKKEKEDKIKMLKDLRNL